MLKLTMFFILSIAGVSLAQTEPLCGTLQRKILSFSTEYKFETNVNTFNFASPEDEDRVVSDLHGQGKTQIAGSCACIDGEFNYEAGFVSDVRSAVICD